MDATIKELVLVSIQNNIEQGVEPAPMWDDPPEIQELYSEAVEAFKTQYGRDNGMTYTEVLAFEITYGVSVIELTHRRKMEEEAFSRLPWWGKTPETDLGA